jgi:hypothetical protein
MGSVVEFELSMVKFSVLLSKVYVNISKHTYVQSDTNCVSSRSLTGLLERMVINVYWTEVRVHLGPVGRSISHIFFPRWNSEVLYHKLKVHKFSKTN